jgi:capsular polysaccharide biosynthesis protein
MKVLDKEVSFRKKPQNINDEDELLFEHEYKKEFKPVLIEEIFNCKVLKTGVIYSNNKIPQIFLNTIPGRKWLVKSYFNLMRNFIYDKGETKSYFLTNSNSLNFFHWHLDILPKLEVLVLKKGVSVIIPEIYNKSFYLETLKLYPEIDFIFLDRNNFFPSLSYFPDTAPTGNYRPSIIKKLHQRILGRGEEASLDNEIYKKIYISRKKANIRKVINEDKIILELITLGFKILYMEDLSYEQQIYFSSNADVILSLHGAGLTHMLYMKPGSKVIEIRVENDAQNNCYFSLASDLNHKYYYLLAKSSDLKKSTQRTDFILPKTFTKELKEILKL